MSLPTLADGESVAAESRNGATVDADEHHVIVALQTFHPLAYVLIPDQAHQKASERLVPHIREREIQARPVSLDRHHLDVAGRNHLQPGEVLERPGRR